MALMTKAGHADMKTTTAYMHMAGVVFRDEAERLEARLLGAPAEEAAMGTKLYPSEVISPDVA